MSTSHGPPSRGRLALALTAAAAAAAPAAAPAAPAAKAGSSRSEVAPAIGHGQQLAPPTRVAQPTEARATTADRARSRPGPVIVEYAVRPAAYAAPASTPASDAPAIAESDAAYDVDAAVAEVELVKLTPVSGGSRLAVVADEPGTLHVAWDAGAARGTTKHQVRAGHHELRLATPRTATHVRVQATLHPSSGSVSASTHAAFRLRS